MESIADAANESWLIIMANIQALMIRVNLFTLIPGIFGLMNGLLITPQPDFIVIYGLLLQLNG
jgi:hypothetical protein